MLKDERAVSKDNEIGNAADSKTLGQFRFALGVHLQNKRSACHFSGERLNFGSGSSTGSAPSGPEVHEYWNSSFTDDFIESGAIYLERLC